MKRPFLLLSCLFLLTACGQGDAVLLNTGQAAPAFQTQRLGGGEARFPADFAGRPLVIRFWADWCRYCEGEMKAIETVYQRHGGARIVVLAVNVGQDEPTVAAFARKIGVSYPLLLDDQAAVARQYGVQGLPTTYFVDAQGVVRAKIVGEADAATFEKNLNTVLH